MATSSDSRTSKAADPSSCSALAQSVGEPLAGTASLATAWIAIEQSGPYGRDALVESRFPPDVGAELATRAAAIGAKVVLVRPVGKHANEAKAHSTRNVWVARPANGSSALDGSPLATADMVHSQISDPAELLAINFDKLLVGNLADAVPHSSPDLDPLLLVCTHAKRDICCALKGRPVALDLSERLAQPERVWEVSHLGGHRMAPTAVQLPDGFLHGRLDSASAEHVWKEASHGRLSLETCRGRSSLEPAAQVAELAVRAHAQLFDLNQVQVVQDLTTDQKQRDEGLGVQTWIVANPRSQDSWDVEIGSRQLADRPESCGKPAVGAEALEVVAIRRRE